MANYHTRGPFVFPSFLSPTLYKQLSLSQSGNKVHWSVNIYQQIKTKRGRILSPGEPIAPSAACVRSKGVCVCVKGKRESTYVFSQWQQPNRKHSCGEEDSKYITVPTPPTHQWKVTTEKLWQIGSDPTSPGLKLGCVSFFGLWAFHSRGERGLSQAPPA